MDWTLWGKLDIESKSPLRKGGRIRLRRRGMETKSDALRSARYIPKCDERRSPSGGACPFSPFLPLSISRCRGCRWLNQRGSWPWGIQTGPLTACWADFVPKNFHLFTLPPIITQFFILQRERERKAGKGRGWKWENQKKDLISIIRDEKEIPNLGTS